MKTITKTQIKALNLVAEGYWDGKQQVPINLRHHVTAPTVRALLKAGLITQDSDKMEHSITESGFESLRASGGEDFGANGYNEKADNVGEDPRDRDGGANFEEED